MKNFFLILLLAFPSVVSAQTVLFRHPQAGFSDYQTALRSTAFRSTPMDELEKRLKNDELPARLQRDLDDVLVESAKTPAEASSRFANFLSRLELEPRSAAVRETMRSLLERLIPGAGAESAKEWRIELSMLQSATLTADLRLQTPVIAREIQARLQQLRGLRGGEDLTLFWNGLRWNERLPVTADQKAQWIFVSSQWKPRLFTGTWSEVSVLLTDDFPDWLSGTCADPVYQDASFVAENRREGLFQEACIAGRETGLPETTSSLSQARFSPALKPLLWTGVAVVGVLAILSATGKKIQIRR